MMEIRKAAKKVHNPTWIGGLILITVIAVFIFSSVILYNRTVVLLTENLRERITGVAVTAASAIKASDLAVLHSEQDWMRPEWSNVVNTLHGAKYANDDVVFMYIFRKTADDPTQMEFIADADSIDPYANDAVDPLRNVDVNRDGVIEADGPDKLQWPGQPYPEAVDIPEAFEAYDGPLTSREIYTDSYGSVITGYAPIVDAAGKTVAILATDVKADDFFTITTQTLRPFLIFILALVIIISILTIILITTWRKYANFLERLNQEKSEFVSFASHQLRSPLTSIKGNASMVMEGDFGPITKPLHDVMDVILKSVSTQIVVVEDYLNASRIELGTMKYNLVPMDFKDLVKEIVNEQKANIDSKGLDCKVNYDGSQAYKISADPDKFKQVIMNLIDNSIKYTPKGTIDISLSKNGSKGTIVFRVSDTGVGINPAVMPKLFQKFLRAENANEANIHGTGLGLFLARDIVKAHGGKVWAESEGEGKGSQFYVEVPEIK